MSSKRRPTITAQMKLDVMRRRNPWVSCEYRLSLSCRGVWLAFIDAQYDHYLALIDGGAHSAENLRYICPECHKLKSAQEHIANCKAKRIAKKASGQHVSKRPMPKSNRKIPSRPFNNDKEYRAAAKEWRAKQCRG